MADKMEQMADEDPKNSAPGFTFYEKDNPIRVRIIWDRRVYKKEYDV